MNEKRHIRINVPVLTRVEGEGALDLEIREGEIKQLQLRIYEPPRYFEKLLEGREHQDVMDLVARICGICPVAYQMSAVQALENAFGFQASAELLNLRRLMYCGEWLQSHSLHIHLLALPDFFNCNNVLELSSLQPQAVQRGLRLQALGNDIIKFFGGRSVHPVGVCVGGFYHTPTLQQAQHLLENLRAAAQDTLDLLDWLCSLPLPDNSQDITFVALRHEHEYPMYGGRIVSSRGLNIDPDDFDLHFNEHHAAHSTALHALHQGKPYLLGPLARMNLNLDRLPNDVLHILHAHNIQFPSRNMFYSVIARAVEIYIALHEALRLLQGYTPAAQSHVPVTPVAATGSGCSEAPRGLLWHQYQTDDRGHILRARIVPPTSQNQARMEEDLRISLQQLGLTRADHELQHYAETLIRNYDPCISCATHFLKLAVQRS
jgi:coenzyme F420-reducing hydrogenase alpha subunit